MFFSNRGEPLRNNHRKADVRFGAILDHIRQGFRGGGNHRQINRFADIAGRMIGRHLGHLAMAQINGIKLAAETARQQILEHQPAQ